MEKIQKDQVFYQSLEVIAEKHAPVILILFDIDDFKVVNDVYGHFFGDYVIREVSQIIKKQLRTSDIGARYGGEEFAVLLPVTFWTENCRVDLYFCCKVPF